MKMKKLMLIPALALSSGAALAQSSVTLFGIADVTVQHGSGSVGSRTALGSGGTSSSRVGFRGAEDLGGGLTAAFWLEAQYAIDSGAGSTTSSNNQSSGTLGGGGLTFNRRSTVSLLGGWGELRVGRDYSVQYHNRVAYDPFSNNGVGATQTNVGSLGGLVSTRVSNAIMYFLPATSTGLYGEAQYYLGENASNAGASAHDGDGGGIRLGYKAGPLDIAIAQARTRYARTATAGNITSSNAGARYDIGAYSIMAGYYRDKVETIAGLTGSGWQVGGIRVVGVGEIRALVSRYGTTAAGRPRSTKFSLGYVHNLSKRTALYASYARVNNTGGATTALNGAITAANHASSGFDLGLRHSF
jgi:predicted porin